MDRRPAPPAGPEAHLDLRLACPTVVVDVSDWLDVATAPGVRAVIDAGLRKVPRRLDVDLTHCELADVHGLHMLEQAQRRAALQGTELVLVGVSARLRRVISLLELDGVLAVEPELAGTGT